MNDFLMEAFKFLKDQALAKELFQQGQDNNVTPETVLKRLKENCKLDECLGSAIVKPDSGKSADKKSTKQQHTANPAIQSRMKFPTCGFDQIFPCDRKSRRNNDKLRSNAVIFYQSMTNPTNKEDTVAHHKVMVPSNQNNVLCVSH